VATALILGVTATGLLGLKADGLTTAQDSGTPRTR